MRLRAARNLREIPDDVSHVEILLTFHLPAGLAERMPRLAWVASPAAGVDRVLRPDLPSEVRVTRTLDVFSRPLAEYALAAILAHAQRHAHAAALQRERRWEQFRPDAVQGRTAGILGAGAIGRVIAHLLGAAGLSVIGLRRSGASDPALERTFAPPDLHAFLGLADYVVLVVPLTAETRGLIGAAELRAMRPGALLVNVARGPVVDEAALVAALREGAIAGAALDVFAVEPLPADSPLWDLPNVRVTPHIAGLSAVPDVAEQFADNLRRYLAGAPLEGAVDRTRGY